MSNTSGLPNSAPWNTTISRHPSKNLIKSPYQPDVSESSAEVTQYLNENPAARVYGSVPQEQNDFQIPPFMLADMQRSGATSFPSTEPVADLRNPTYRSKVDSLKHVAITSQNSVRQNVLAARPQSTMMPSTMSTNANGDSLLARYKPVTASLHPAALFQQPATAMPGMAVRPPQQPTCMQAVAPGRPIAPAVQREMPPHSALTKFLLMVLLVSSFIPAFINIADSISLYTIASHGYSGIEHLLHVRTLADDLKAHPTNLDISQLKQMQSELQDANQDFIILHTELTRDTYINAASYGLPQYTNSILALSKIGADASDIGQALTKMVIDFAPALHSSALAASTKPLVTQAMLDEAQSFLTYSLPLMHDIQSQTPLLSLDALPINSTQREQISEAIQLVPLAVTDMEQAKDLMSAVGWILGVGQPRTFLVQTMDRAELRPTGGFTGQFGELKLTSGRMGPFKLQNIALFEYGTNSPNVGKSPPAAYQSWWPIANWGVRDSNLSADFPTSANITMNTYQYEFHDKVDGLIVFSPFLISRVLAATGPIFVPKYNETITADNVESKLHYYQLDNTGIRKEELIEHVYNGDDARKLFTGRVTQLLMDKVKHAQVSVLVGIAHEMLTALKTRDLQVYVSNTQIENLLVKYDAAAVMDRSTTQDGLFVVQANVSANKGSQYVQTLMQDQVTLDKSGGATHQLQIHLIYHVVDQIYGPDTYHDYIRVYVPPNAQYLSGNGFEQLGKPYCSSYARFQACPMYDAYGDGDLMCPANQSDPMVETNQINDPYALSNHPLNEEGGPTNMTSDEPQRAMYAGWVLIPKNCDATITLSWYVPSMSHDAYSLTVQRQSGTYPVMDVTILPTPSACTALKTAGQYFHSVLSQDQTFSLIGQDAEGGANASCYVQPKL